MAVWEVTNQDQINSVFSNQFTRYSWTNRYLWSFNTLVNLNNLETEQQPTLISQIMALENCGTRRINCPPDNTRGKLNSILNRLDRDVAWTSTGSATLGSKSNDTSEGQVNTLRSFNRRTPNGCPTLGGRSCLGERASTRRLPNNSVGDAHMDTPHEETNMPEITQK